MKYVNQAPKGFNAQSAAFKKRWGSVEALWPAGWLLQPKYDGVHVMIHTSTGRAFSRTGEPILSVPHLIAQATEVFGVGWVLFLEAYTWGVPHQEINGAVRRKTPQASLIGIVYDAVTQVEFDAGFAPDSYKLRLARVKGCTICTQALAHPPVLNATVEAGSVDAQARRFQDSQVSAYDGVILRDPDAPWRAGAAKEGEVIKVKPTMSLDLYVIGEFAEKRDTKLGGYLTVTHNGVTSNVGSGLDQQQLGRILRCAGLCETAYIGSVVEVECLGLTPVGRLREPRLKGIRWDTETEDNKE